MITTTEYLYPVHVTYDDGYNVQEGTFNLNAVLLANLEVTTNPAKTSYKYGESINYSGLVVTASYSDGTTENVTDSCIITPAAGKAFDPETDTSVEIIYTTPAAMETATATLMLTAISLTGISVTSNPNKTNYKYGEAIDYTGLVVTASYSDGTKGNVTNSCIITPAAGKAFDPQTDSNVTITYADSQGYSTSLLLTEVSLTSISITSNPNKTIYKYGESIDYTGLVVTASYSGGITEDITASCTITPAAGKAFDPATDSTINISYSMQGSDGLITESIELNLTAITLTSISVTSNPVKVGYTQGEIIDYTGLVVTASYSDGSTNDVTALCSITPASGKAFDPETDTLAEISYSEGQTTATTSLMLTERYLTGISVTTNPTKIAYKYDERISYAGMVVTASYSDSSTLDVTNQCTISPANNKKFNADTDTYVDISYTEGQNEATCMLTLTPILLTALEVTSNPTKTTYSSGESIDYSGIVITATYSDNTTDNVTAKCTFSPASGKSFNPDTDSIAIITYSEGENEQTCTFVLGGSSMTLRIDTLPTKTKYVIGDVVDYSGAVIKAVLLDGTEHTVTNYCSYTPSVDGAQTTVTVSCAEPAEPYVYDQNSGYVDNGTWKYENPTNTYIDIYTVTAGHKYLLTLGKTVGSRFRAMFTTTDVSQASENVSGTKIINTNNPAAYASAEYTAPSDGYIVVAKDNVGVSGLKSYLYDADASIKPVTTTFTLATIESEYTLIVEAMPTKWGYKSGDTIDYTGIKMNVYHIDGDEHTVTDYCSFSLENGSVINADTTVTVSCAPPLTPHAFDKIPSNSNYRIDVYRVISGHHYLIALGRNTGDIFNVTFSLDESRGTEYVIKRTTGAAYASVEYTPSSDGYIFIEKDSSRKSGIKTYLYDGDSSTKSLHTTFNLTVGVLESIAATKPVIARYRTGDTFDYTGVIVTANYSDGHIENVTEDATFSPAEGSTVISSNPASVIVSPVSVSYTDTTGISKNTSFDVTTGGVAIVSLSVTPPNKTSYYEGEQLDYTGCTVMAVYWDGSTKDVTSQVTFDPPSGRVVSDGYWDEAQDIWVDDNTQHVTISYSETDAVMATNIGSPTCINYQEVGTRYDSWDSYKTLSSATVATYEVPYFDTTSGETKTITYINFCTDFPSGCIDKENRITVADVADLQARVDEENASLEARGQFLRWHLESCPIIVEVGGFIEGRQYGYQRDIYTAIFVVDNIEMTYPVSEGFRGVVPGISRFIPLMQVSYGSETSYPLNLNVIKVLDLLITPPTKTTYHYKEGIDYTGLVVTASYSNAETADVTSKVNLYPSQGTLLSSSRDATVYYLSTSKNIAITVIRLSSITVTPPTKTSYNSGEMIDYTGAIVTAVYSDGSTETVTSSAVFSPSAGTVITADVNVSVSYTNQWSETATSSFSLSVITDE